MPEQETVVASLAAGAPRARGRCFNVQAMLQDVVDWHGPAARASGVQVLYGGNVAASDWVRADETRIREICDDLVGRGLELSARGTLRLSADLQSSSAAYRSLRVSVCGASQAVRGASSALGAACIASEALGARLDIEHAADGQFCFALQLTVRGACEPPHDSALLSAATQTRVPSSALRSLPWELRASLRHAALRADRRALRLLVAQLDTRDPDAARLVREWVELFQYEPLLAFCGSQRAVRPRARPVEGA